MSSEFQPLTSEDVISIKEISRILISHNTFTTSELMKALHNNLGVRNQDKERQKWFDEGVPCKVLQPGKDGWKDGKVKLQISLEFCADDPADNQVASELDSLRQTSFD